MWDLSVCPPVWILTLCSLEVNWSLTVKMWPLSISLDLGSFERTRWVGFPQAKDCSARTKSLSGISVSCWISCQNQTRSLGKKWDMGTIHPSHARRFWKEHCFVPTSKVYFSLLLRSMTIVIWKVETCNMCFRLLEPVTWAPPTPTSEPSSCR